MTPLFSVIIPTYHRNDLLGQCLDRLAPGAQLLSSDRYEVIVTDDGSQTTAEQMIRERHGWAKWVSGPGKGPAANRNNGARAASAEWLAFLDDDCLPDLQWLKSYHEAIAAYPNYAVFEGRVYASRPKRSLAETAPIFENGGGLPSGNFVCSKKVFLEFQGFDERFPYAAMEDMDLRKRLSNADYRFMFIREASVCHPWRQIGGWQSLKRSQMSAFIYLSLHPEEQSWLNAHHFFRMGVHRLVTDTIPSFVRFRGRGISKAILELVAIFQSSFLLIGFANRKSLRTPQADGHIEAHNRQV
jgi:GT2 family glycosyltransferase